MRRQRFSREQIAEADQRDILGVARELNLKLEKRKNTYKENLRVRNKAKTGTYNEQKTQDCEGC